MPLRLNRFRLLWMSITRMHCLGAVSKTIVYMHLLYWKLQLSFTHQWKHNYFSSSLNKRFSHEGRQEITSITTTASTTIIFDSALLYFVPHFCCPQQYTHQTQERKIKLFPFSSVRPAAKKNWTVDSSALVVDLMYPNRQDTGSLL